MGEAALQIGSILKTIGLVFSPLLVLPLIILLLGRPVQKIGAFLTELLDPVSGGALFLAKFAALSLILVQLAVILGRYIFGWSASWLNEIVIYSFAILFLLAAASALKSDDHVRVDIFRGRMSAQQRAGIDMAGYYLFFFPICILILWTVAGSSSFAESWLKLEGSRESDGLPVYFLFRTLIPAFAILMLLQGLSEAIKSAMILRGLREPPPEHKAEHGAA